MKFDYVYKTLRLTHMNPDSEDALTFMYTYELISKGMDMNEISDIIESNDEKYGFKFTPEFKSRIKEKGAL